MKNEKASAVAEAISTQLGDDTGFITSAVVSFSTVDAANQERVLVMYDGALMHAAKLAEYAAERLEQIIYNGEDQSGEAS